MTDWSDGYVTEVGYTHGFYRELVPLNLQLAALNAGVKPPTGRLRYLELGCGQGLSANIIAAANPDVSVTAIDFNPAHIVAHAISPAVLAMSGSTCARRASRILLPILASAISTSSRCTASIAGCRPRTAR